MSNRYAARRDRLRRLVRKSGADAMLITSYINVRYLTGFTGDSSYLLLLRDGEVLLSDFRFQTELAEDCPDVESIARGQGVSMLDIIEKVVKKARPKSLAFEAHNMNVSFHTRLSDSVKFELMPTTGLVEELRMIKDKEEVARIRDAVAIAEKAFGVIRASLLAEQTEKEVADQLVHQMRLFGARDCAFPSIVGVGPNAALPHAIPGSKKIGENPILLIDWGACEGWYNSDLTRVLVTARIPPKLERIYDVVKKAQAAAIAKIRPGVTCGEVDEAARSVIAKARHGKHFGHSLGHGIGLEVHEAPRLAGKEEQPLKTGMVVTVEPGIYLPGWGGVRLEDDVLVTRSGHEVLTSVTKDWSDVHVG
ncbi:MAG: Xaa-Pro peptidase family protein [Pirellulales bacterium]|nr:Xaa-Pro peptidase family protein [Pirellulales bacterium]